MGADKRVMFALRITPAARDRLRADAKEFDMSISELARVALGRGLLEVEKEQRAASRSRSGG
jgi:hypothetical protein